VFEMNLGHIRKLVVGLSALFALTALVPSAASATTTPAPGYGQFTGCPNPAQIPSIEICFHTVFTSGEFQVGGIEFPISNPITYSGGLTPSFEVDFNASGGMSKVPQPVPGGLVGLTGLTWLLELYGASELTLYADIELAGTPGAPLPETLSLPVRIHLTNPLLDNCYIGSNAEPIPLDLITGTTSPPPPNEPITGTEPTISITPNEVLDLEEGTYVDNSFAAPEANGCVLTIPGYSPISIDSLINSQNGLPAAAGTNRAIFDYDTELVESAIVYP
jgi:hypothetical protein